MNSPHFSFDVDNIKATLKVFAWTIAAAVVTLLISIFASLEIPPQYLFLVPIVNTTLYALKEYIGKQER